MRYLFLFAITLSIALPSSLSAQGMGLTAVILVRHAERDDGVDALNDIGKARAEALKDELINAGVDAIYASTFNRTQQTAQPLAEALGLEIKTYNASNLPALVNALESNHVGETVLVVGHSNTTPQTANALGIDETLPDYEHDAYDDLLIVNLTSCGKTILMKLKYN